MIQPQWTILLVRIALIGLLVLITLSIFLINLQKTSHNFNFMFLREQNEDIVVPIEEPTLGSKNNSMQHVKSNYTQLVWPIKETIKYGITNGLIVIVNVSSKDEENSLFVAASQHRATSNLWDINGALDGYMGELIAQVMEEIEIVEEYEDVVVETMKKCHQKNSLDHLLEQNDTKQGTLEQTTSWPYKMQWYGPSLHSLVVFSSFRLSETNFFAIVLLGTLPFEKLWSNEFKLDTCAWIHWKQTPPNIPNELDSPRNEKYAPVIQMGTQSVIVANELHRTAYDVAVIKCAFEDPAGADAQGGHLHIKINHELCPVFHEAFEEINTIQFEGEYEYDFAFCSPPILWDFNVTHLREWFMYHHFLFHTKKIHYFIYHGIDMSNEIMAILDPFIKEELLTLVDLRSRQSNLLSGQYPSHHLSINDCLHRVRYLTKWAFFWTFEDYLDISFPETISSILEKYSNDSWISLGSVLWSHMYCCAPSYQNLMLNKTMWKVDEMCFRMKHPMCNGKGHSSTCPGFEGQRKWIANPRHVFAASIHYVLDSQSIGIVLDTDIAQFNVYKGLLNPNSSKDNCMSIKKLEDFNDDIPLSGMWWKDLRMRNYTKAAQYYAKSSKLFNSNFINPIPSWLFNYQETI